MSDTVPITEFLTARLDEDEAVAREAIDDDSGQDGGFEDAYEDLIHSPSGVGIAQGGFGEAAARMIVWNTPRRMLADVAAKRAIVELHASVEDRHWKSGSTHGYLWCRSCGSLDDGPVAYPCATTAALLRPYADHPEYREEWATHTDV